MFYEQVNNVEFFSEGYTEFRPAEIIYGLIVNLSVLS